jgi:hypothetical protein
VNSHMGQRYARTFSFIVGAGIVGLLLGPVASVISLSHAASPPPRGPEQSPGNSGINLSMPGSKKGVLRMITGSTAQIDNATYPLTPRIIVETPTGKALASQPDWQKRLPYPVPVQYWVGKTGITQMIVFLNK